MWMPLEVPVDKAMLHASSLMLTAQTLVATSKWAAWAAVTRSLWPTYTLVMLAQERSYWSDAALTNISRSSSDVKSWAYACVRASRLMIANMILPRASASVGQPVARIRSLGEAYDPRSQ